MYKKKNLPNLIMMIGIVTFFLSLLIFVSYFGFPLTDESFPIATGLRFLQGQRPFIDDLTPYMCVGLLLTPLIKLSLLLHQGKNELILFMRHAFIIVAILFGIQTFFSTKKYLPLALAFFLAVLVTVFHPFAINNFHYDTLAVMLWSVILFQLYNLLFSAENKPYQYFLFSFYNLALCLAYPTFIFLLFPLYGLCYFSLKNSKLFWITHFCVLGTASLFFGWLIFGYYNVQFSDVMNAVHFTQNLFKLSSNNQGSSYKLITVFHELFVNYKEYIFFSFLFIGMAFWSRKISWLVPILLTPPLIMPFYLVDFKEAAYTEVFYFYNCIGFLGIIIFLIFYRKHDQARRLFYSISMPALAGGILTSMTSYNLILNFNIGFFPASLLGFVFAYKVIQDYCRKNWLTNAVLVYGFMTLAFFHANYIYGAAARGLNIYRNTHQVTANGPFNGLYLDAYWFGFLNQLQNDLKKLDTDPDKFAYFGPASAGYLMTDHLKPGEYFLYCAYAIHYSGVKMRLPNYTFDFSRAIGTPAKDIQTYLADTNHRVILTTKYYDVYHVS